LHAAVPAEAPAAKHPRYGGTLRVELRDVGVSLDPRAWKPGTIESAASEKIAALVFDRLVSLDNYGRFQPQLASEWSHDAAFKRWQFRLRDGVKFTDDTPLSAADVAAALQPLLPVPVQASGRGEILVLQSSAPMPDVLELLASGRHFIYRQSGDTLVGTGPFFIAETTSPAATDAKTTRYLLRANDTCWAGRPFVDAVEVTLGFPALRRLLDLQLGKADVIEIAPELARRAAQEKLRVWVSAPVVTFGLRIDSEQPAGSSARLREALSNSLDRATVANVLLQRQAEPAAALLPQWLSGYAFLFDVDTNLERAKQLRAAQPTGPTSGSDLLRLRVDASGDLAKLVAERVAVNARQAGLSVQVVPRTPAAASSDPAAALNLFAWHVTSLSPRLELDALLKSMAVKETSPPDLSATDAAQLFARERRILGDRYLLPIVVLPEYAGLNANVRNWLPSRWGEWHLADVWLDFPDVAETSGAPSAAKWLPASPLASGARP
jgi:ABC-type transport system substrate-binding protein